MKLRNLIIYILCVVMVLGTLPETAGAAPDRTSLEDLQNHLESSNYGISAVGEKPQLIVKYKNINRAQATLASVEQEIAAFSATPDMLGDKVMAVTETLPILGIELIHVEENTSLADTIQALEAEENVEFVQPNYLLESFGAAAEPGYPKQWALENPTGWDVNIAGFWDGLDRLDTTLVAVIDGGMDVSHEELAGRTAGGWDFYNDDESVFDAGDNAHGTWIAGVIAAAINGKGIAGLAPNAKIMPLKFAENGKGYTSDALAAIEYAAEKGVRVINCSWGSMEYNPALRAMMEENEDILFVCAAGNNGNSEKIYPAGYNLPNVLSVASLESSGALASSSGYGSFVELAAPGENIYTTIPQDGYGYASGTSLAAAYAAGAAALYSGANPKATGADIAKALKSSAAPMDALENKVTYGALDIGALMGEDGQSGEEEGKEPGSFGAIEDILESKRLYTALSEQDRATVRLSLDVTDEAMLICAGDGMGILASVPVAQIMAALDITIEEARALAEGFATGELAAIQARRLNDYRMQSETFKQADKQTFGLLAEGIEADGIARAFVAAYVFDLSLPAIIDRQSSPDAGGTADLALVSLAAQYNVTAALLESQMQAKDLSLEALAALLEETQNELGLVFDSELELYADPNASDDNIEPLPNAPYQYRAGVNESVNLNTGALVYEETLASLPGRNGLDLNLVLRYQSSESYGMVDAANMNKYPQKYMGKGWSLNFTRILYQNDGRYVRFSDGSTYKIIRKGVGYGLENYKLEDVTVTWSGSVYTLDYADGRKERFDTMGNIAFITDRYNNSISFRYNALANYEREILITDSTGAVTRILWNESTAARSYIFVLPDESTITVGVSAKGQLTGWRDQMGRTTSYTYKEEKDVFSGRTYQTLTQVRYPTGLAAVNTFKPGSYKITHMVKTDKGKRYLYESYAYEGDFATATRDYSTRVTNADGTVTTHVFDYKKHLKKTETITVGGSKKVETTYAYNAYELPSQITQFYHNGAGTVMRMVGVLYGYDKMGNVTSYVGPMAEGKGDQRYAVGYAYDGAYNQLTAVTYQKDENTTIRQEYSLTGDKKAPREAAVYENGELKQKQGFTYDAYGNIIEIKDYYDRMSYRSTTMAYDRGAYLASQTQGGVTTAMAYGEMGRLLSVTDGNGNTTSFTYDKLGRVLKTTFPDGSSTENTYQDVENILTVMNELGNKIQYSYDGFGNILKVTDLSTGSALSAYTYDAMLRVIQKTDGNGNKGLYEYDYADRVVKQSTGSYVETFQYLDAYNYKTARVIRTIEGDKDAPAIRTFKDLDYEGKEVKSGYFMSGIEYAQKNEYDYIGNIVKILTTKDEIKGYSYSSLNTYDHLGNIKSQTIEDGATTFNKYDWLGRQISTTDPMGNIIKYTYDDLDRLIREEIPFVKEYNMIKEYRYDLNDNLIYKSITSGTPDKYQVKEIHYEYDNRDRLINTLEEDKGENYVTQTRYDAAGNITALITGNGRSTTQYSYNSLNQMVKLTDPLGQQEIYHYDLNGNLIGKTDRNGNEISNVYDHLNNLLKSAVYSQGDIYEEMYYKYGANGALIYKGNKNLETTYYYDQAGRMIKETDTSGVDKVYGYDSEGFRSSFKMYLNGILEHTVNYDYDKQNRLTVVTENGSAAVTYSYDLNGNCTAALYGNEMEATYTYNLAGLVTNITYRENNSILSGYSYTYYLDGNQQSKTSHTGETTEYVYDGLDRLILEKASDTTTQYSYDEQGNRSQMQTTGAENYTTTYKYDGNNRLQWEQVFGEDSTPTAATQYYYDANGNRLAKTSMLLSAPTGQPAGIGIGENAALYELYTYNPLNQLTTYEGDGIFAEYEYRCDNFRLSKTVNGEKTTHIWDGSNIVMELDNSDKICDLYLWAGELIKNSNEYYIIDAHRDVIQTTGEDKNTYKEYKYNAFGVLQTVSKNDTNPFRYAGEYCDWESGLIYLRTRHYDPAIGQFTNEDPIRDGMNWYAYCNNNPVNYIDPSGNITISTTVAFVVLTSAAIGALISATGNILSQGLSKGWDNINIKEVWINFGAGALSGGLAGTGAGLLIIVPANAAIASATYGFTQRVNGEEIEMKGIVLSGVIGGVAGWIGDKGVFSGAEGKKVLDQMNTAQLAKMLGLKSGTEINEMLVKQYFSSAALTNTIRTTFSVAFTNIGSKYLEKGSTGYEVEQLQGMLGLEATGTFDNKTQNSLKELQKQLGVSQTGKYDKETRKALGKALK